MCVGDMHRPWLCVKGSHGYLHAWVMHVHAALAMCYHDVCVFTLNHLGLSHLPLSLAWFMGTGFYIVLATCLCSEVQSYLAAPLSTKSKSWCGKGSTRHHNIT